MTTKKPVYIYLIRTECEPNYKIGLTNNIQMRMKPHRTGNPDKLIVLKLMEVANPYKVESSLKNQYSHLKTSSKNEWFQLSIAEEVGFEELVKKQDEIFTFLKENTIGRNL